MIETSQPKHLAINEFRNGYSKDTENTEKQKNYQDRKDIQDKQQK
jgi:hypothetical protein